MLQKTKPPMPKQKDPPLSRTISEPDQPAPPPPRHGHERIHKRAPIPEPINTQDSDDSSSVKKIIFTFSSFHFISIFILLFILLKNGVFCSENIHQSVYIYIDFFLFIHQKIPTEFSTHAFIVYWP